MVLLFLSRISPVLTLRSWSIASVLKMIAPSGVFSVVAERYGVRINCGANRSLITLTITVASAVRSGVLWSLTWTWNCWRKRKMTQMIIFLSNHVFYEQCVSLPLKISKKLLNSHQIWMLLHILLLAGYPFKKYGIKIEHFTVYWFSALPSKTFFRVICPVTGLR